MSSRSDKRRSGLARFWLALAGTFVVLTGVVLALPMKIAFEAEAQSVRSGMLLYSGALLLFGGWCVSLEVERSGLREELLPWFEQGEYLF